MTVGSRDVEVLGTHLHVQESGSGPHVLLLHGNPTSSYLWRHLLRPGIDGWHLVAPDLVGMGRSGKPDLEYRFIQHADHVEALVDALGLERYVVLAHDWGGPLGLELHRRRPARVTAFAFMESRLRALPSWEDFDDGRDLFRALREPGTGERMVLEQNFFLETLLPAALGEGFPAADLAVYREPYPDPRSRRPLLKWPREIPVAGEPADVAALVTTGLEALAASGVPVHLVRGGDGVVLGPRDAEWYRRHLPTLTECDVGPGGHFLPEGRPTEVRRAVAAWLSTLRER